MKKRTKILISVAAAIGVLLIIAAVFASRSAGTAITTETVKRMDLFQTVEVTGELKSVDEIELAFASSGTVYSVAAEVGDVVHAGDLLAALDAGELQADYEEALGRLMEAKAALALELAGISVEQQAVAEAGVRLAEIALSAAEGNVTYVTSVSDASVATAEADVARTATETADAFVHAREDVVEATRSLVAEVRSALADADTILGIENNLFNNEFERQLANQDSSTIREAEVAFEIAAEGRDAAEEALLDMDETDDASVLAVADLAEVAYEDAYETLLDTSRVLDATSANSPELTIEDLIAFKTTISTAQSTLVADGTALTNARQSYTDAENALTTDVIAAENALASAEAARDRDVAAAEAAVSAREGDLAKAEAELSELTADPRGVDLASYEAAVVQAEARTSAALARLQQKRIIAPIDGIVTAIDIDPGESASMHTPVVTLLASGDEYEIVLDIPEADVAKVQLGQDADVTFDAFGDDVVFKGSVFSIDPAEHAVEGVVFYKATVLLHADQDLTMVKPGLSATVTIHTNERLGVLAIPSRAVLEKDGMKYVRIPTADGYVERSVTVGLRGDEGWIEVVEGLSEDETVIVSIRD